MIPEPVLPGYVENILKCLNRNGFEAYIVGGCVRDCIMGRTPADWDISTSAKPQQVKDIFGKTYDTGLKHGTVTVVIGERSSEVTTFRVDGAYEDARHPSSVEYTASVEADLSRRDFTMNAIAYHPEAGFVDPFGGIGDIEAELIRTVGRAGDRFREDALRMLRAVRFSAQLDFSADNAVLLSIGENCGLIANISGERIRDELTRILVSGNPLKFALLEETGLLHFIMPEFERCFHTPQNHPYHIYNVALHSLHAVAAIENDRCLRWAMLLHDIGKSVTRTTDDAGVDHFYGHPAKSAELAGAILKRLRFDNRSIDRILRLVRLHDREIAPAQRNVARAVCSIGEDIFEDLLKVKAADKTAQNPEYREEGLNAVGQIRRIYLDMKEKGRCLALKDLAINGDDLVGMGWKQGREIGRVLGQLLQRVVDEPELNRKDRLLELAGGLAAGRKRTE
jgi:tRNA nucleotidyltransferase (CCA-adding enzyme)